MTDVTEKGSDFIKDLGDAARRNPISAALIGMGLVWLFAGGKSAARSGRYPSKDRPGSPSGCGKEHDERRTGPPRIRCRRGP